MLRRACHLAIPLLIAAFVSISCTNSDAVIVGVGTTVQDSGLMDALKADFEQRTGYDLKVIALGTGQLLRMGERGDLDALLTHAPQDEEEFVANGYGIDRQLVMYNDFVIVGPADGPVDVGRAEDAITALHAIRKSELPFISRGDDSGTHKLERSLWDELGFDPSGEGWYVETGQGMGGTLLVADQRNAYTITDRGTYLSQRDNVDLEIVFEGDAALLNVYHVMRVNPDAFDGLNSEGAAAFVAYMISDEAQALIATFGVAEYGERLFIPGAGKSEDDLR
jgi:tungstate transport system substrate-binding protein